MRWWEKYPLWQKRKVENTQHSIDVKDEVWKNGGIVRRWARNPLGELWPRCTAELSNNIWPWKNFLPYSPINGKQNREAAGVKYTYCSAPLHVLYISSRKTERNARLFYAGHIPMLALFFSLCPSIVDVLGVCVCAHVYLLTPILLALPTVPIQNGWGLRSRSTPAPPPPVVFQSRTQNSCRL